MNDNLEEISRCNSMVEDNASNVITRVRFSPPAQQTNCELCNKEHDGSYGSGRFCSVKCARSSSTKEKREEINEKVSLKMNFSKKICKKCGIELLRFGLSKINSLYCNECRSKNNRCFSRKNRLFDDIKSDRVRKITLIKERGHQCERCKFSNWMGDIIPIQLHHIDGNPDNNVKENLQLLCPTCHAQMPTWTSKNIGNHIGTKRQAHYRKYGNYRYR